MIRGVIFDLDGVLVSTDEFHYRGWKRMADSQGIPFNREINNRLRGVSRARSLGIILERAPRKYSVEEQVVLAACKNGYYQELLRHLNPEDTLPGAREMLHELRAREIKIAIASSSRNAQLIVDYVALGADIDAVVTGNDVAHSKPHPELFLKAAERIGLQPSECVVVEDAEVGVEAGLAAGMKVLGVGFAAADRRAHLSAPGLNATTVDRLLALGS